MEGDRGHGSVRWRFDVVEIQYYICSLHGDFGGIPNAIQREEYEGGIDSVRARCRDCFTVDH